ncbi:MAG: DNA helicase PcrA [bacterium]
MCPKKYRVKGARYIDFLGDLNEPQQEAVLHTEGPVLILAGAGSGKTRALTYRVAYVLASGRARPWEILAVTFTNKAADEMRERVIKLIGEEGKKVRISTFHSACVRILREQIEALGYTRNFTIYDESDQLDVLTEVIREINIDEKRFSPKMMRGRISSAKDDLIGPAQYAAQESGFIEKQVARVYAQYQEKLRRNNTLDFDDLIMLTVQLFQEHPKILEIYQDRWRYIMVDEYQDTNRAQYVLVKQLAGKHRNICVVGDDFQSIYKFRGADITNILNFEDDYPDAKVIKLEQNYRSTKTILEGASQVIKNNRYRKDKKLWTANQDGEPITLEIAQDPTEEAEFIAREIKRLRSKGKKYSDFAVLYRTNAQSRPIEDVLRRRNIKYTIVGGVKFYERMEIKDILAYLRLIVNPEDSVALRRIINVPRRGIGKATLEKLLLRAKEENKRIRDLLRDPDEIGGLTPTVRRNLKEFAKGMEELREIARTQTASAVLQEVLERTQYIENLEMEKTEEARDRINNVQELMASILDFEQRRGGEASVEEFLGEVSLLSDIDAWDGRREEVTLMTLHNAKGLEFPVVFITGMEENLFPHANSLAREEDLEEERRLCYVGITRAKEKLYLTCAEERRRWEGYVYNSPSRFIGEIPAHLLEGGDRR